MLMPFSEEYNNIEIPDLPMIIVVPVSLLQQYQDEIRRYTQFAHIDLAPYQGFVDSRKTFWTAAWKQSNQPNIRKILLATTTVECLLLAAHRGTLTVWKRRSKTTHTVSGCRM